MAAKSPAGRVVALETIETGTATVFKGTLGTLTGASQDGSVCEVQWDWVSMWSQMNGERRAQENIGCGNMPVAKIGAAPGESA